MSDTDRKHKYPAGRQCVVCHNNTGSGDIYCSRACAIKRQIQAFGAPVRQLAIEARLGLTPHALDENTRRANDLEQPS